MKRNFFDVSNIIFWILLGLIGLFLLPYLKEPLYDENKVTEWVQLFDTVQPIPQQDTIVVIDTTTSDTIKYAFKVWDWHDFDGEWRSIKFKYKVGSLDQATINRASSTRWNPYRPLYEHDKELLKDLIMQMKAYIKTNNLTSMEALEYVCSSIQDIPYTLVTDEPDGCPCEMSFGSFSGNCRVQTDGDGCCEGVVPFAVYSPFEFVYHETGDCDTRALLAFTILKPMGFDVAVMGSDSKRHAVLGVADIGRSGYSYGRNKFGKKYYLWELTSESWRFGDEVDGYDWFAELE
jgi:hypothetical protein